MKRNNIYEYFRDFPRIDGKKRKYPVAGIIVMMIITVIFSAILLILPTILNKDWAVFFKSLIAVVIVYNVIIIPLNIIGYISYKTRKNE